LVFRSRQKSTDNPTSVNSPQTPARLGADRVAKLRLAAAMKLHELGHLSSGAAAELAGVTMSSPG
jgi:hypothetical protein